MMSKHKNNNNQRNKNIIYIFVVIFIISLGIVFFLFIKTNKETTLKNQLEQYKQLKLFVEQAEKVINNKYDKNEKEMALNMLKNIDLTFFSEEEQNKYIKKYRTLLKEYCDVTFEVYSSTAGLNGFLPDYPEEVQKEVRNFLEKTPKVRGYPFLLKEVNGFIENGFYKTSVQKVNCE